MALSYHFRKAFWRGIVALLALSPLPAWSQQQTPVAIELLLALDASASMDREEFELQIHGLAEAFKDPAVLKAIKQFQPQGVALSVMQWGSPGEKKVIVPFTHVVTEMEARAFGFLASRGTRGVTASSTAIAFAIEDGVDALELNGFTGLRRTIDISGDGIDNSGLDLKAARNLAEAAGITVNGLAIEAENKGLTDYYRENVIVGSESFAIRAKDFEDYARAIREKLLRELRPLES
jgi:hypothetical protein